MLPQLFFMLLTKSSNVKIEENKYAYMRLAALIIKISFCFDWEKTNFCKSTHVVVDGCTAFVKQTY